jgi:hypothetical protein
VSNPATKIFRFRIREPPPPAAPDGAGDSLAGLVDHDTSCSSLDRTLVDERPSDSQSSSRLFPGDRPRRLGTGPRRALPPARSNRRPTPASAPRGPFVRAGLLLGAGVAGCVVQLLRTQAAPAELAAPHHALLHAGACLALVLGLAALWRQTGAPRPTATFVGALLLGSGVFATLAGTVDLALLAAPRVDARVLLDRGLIAASLMLAAAGALCLRTERSNF